MYKQGKDNAAANGLSRISGPHLLTMTLSTLQTDLLDKVKGSWLNDTQKGQPGAQASRVHAGSGEGLHPKG